MKRETVLWIEDVGEFNERDREHARLAGFTVLQKRNLDLWDNHVAHLDDFVAVAFITTKDNSPRVFRNIKTINDFRMVSGHLRPILAVVPPSSFPACAQADFSPLGCCVLPNLRADQVFSFLQVLVAAQAAIDRQGVSIWQPPITGHPIVVGPNALNAELRLKGLQRKMWSALSGRCGQIVFTDDLAEEAGCTSDQVRVHIERIRDKFVACAQKVVLGVDRDEFIETLDGGYRLNAQVRE
jgi:hypothetical protein